MRKSWRIFWMMLKLKVLARLGGVPTVEYIGGSDVLPPPL